jgi:hypothetical protein
LKKGGRKRIERKRPFLEEEDRTREKLEIEGLENSEFLKVRE